MGRQLTKRHSLIFEKKAFNPFSFARDIYQYGKLRELVSFAVWEGLHRLRLFPRRLYLRFREGEPIALGGSANEGLTGQDFTDKLDRFFGERGLRVQRVEHNWKRLFIAPGGEMFGCVYPDDRDLYRSIDNGRTILLVRRFPESIKSIFISSQNTIFVCAKGAVYRSADDGGSFEKCLDMGSSVSFFRHNNAMTETPAGTLMIGEYGNVWEGKGWRKLAYLYTSSDEGADWRRSDFLIRQGTNKHVHLVKYSRLFDRLFVADGDNYKKLWVSGPLSGSGLESPGWKAVNRFHIQMGGYTSVIEDDERLLFGTDYQGGTNFLVETRDGERFSRKIVPDPYRRSPIDNMVQRKSTHGREIWAVLPYSTANSRCLLMYTADGGESWDRVLEYRRGDHNVWLINSSNEVPDELYFSVENLRNGERVVHKLTNGD